MTEIHGDAPDFWQLVRDGEAAHPEYAESLRIIDATRDAMAAYEAAERALHPQPRIWVSDHTNAPPS